MILFEFNKNSDMSHWNSVDDVVMGGKSNGTISLNEAGLGVFSGKVSLENNGGFSMVKYHFDSKQVSGFTTICLKLKGDGKTYQFRVKTSVCDIHSYVAAFKTTTNWNTIEIPFNSMYPSFRGKPLKMPNYPGEKMAQIAFLIGNNTEETFKLEIDSIYLK